MEFWRRNDLHGREPASCINTFNPGLYPVTYHATVDTAGFVLESVTVLKVDCVDQLGVGLPDLYVLVFDPAGMKVFDSSPDVDNTPLPYNFPVNLRFLEAVIIPWQSGMKTPD